jgi:hypothetical protein
MPDLIRHPVLFLDSPVKPGNDDFWLFFARIILLSRSYRHTTLAIPDSREDYHESTK